MSFLPNDSDDESEADHEIFVNKVYARKFEDRERLRELERAKHLDLDEDDDEDDESEDDEAELLTTQLDLQVIKVINSIRRKDPKIYDPTSTWFEQTEDDENTSIKADGDENANGGKSHQKVKKTFKDVLRDQLLEDAVENDSNKGEDIAEITEAPKRLKLRYDKEQEELRTQLLQSLQDAGDDSDDDEGNNLQSSLLVPKQRTRAEDELAEKELQAALEEMERSGPAAGVTDAGIDSEVDKDRFLREYTARKRWVDRTGTWVGQGRGDDDEEEEEELNRADRFESKYNFRFEELENGALSDEDEHGEKSLARVRLDAYQVQGHARQVEGSLRRSDDSRKQQREARAERKAREIRQKKAELMRLRNIKKQELLHRLRRIREIGGLNLAQRDDSGEGVEDDAEAGGLNLSVLEGDWDPEEHDRAMQRSFGDGYYAQAGDDKELFVLLEEGDAGGEGLDPGTAALLGEVDGLGYEDGLGVWKGDDIAGELEMKTGKTSKRDRRRNRKENKGILTNGNYELLNGEVAAGGHNDNLDDSYYIDESEEDGAIGTALEELYALDYEDIIAGQPCRFRYRVVPPEDYGLEAEDILAAEDVELNQYVSLRRLAPYRGHGRSTDAGSEQAKLARKRKKLRAAIKQRLANSGESVAAGAQVVDTVVTDAVTHEIEDRDELEPSGRKVASVKKRRRKRRADGPSQDNDQEDGAKTKELDVNKVVSKHTQVESTRAAVPAAEPDTPTHTYSHIGARKRPQETSAAQKSKRTGQGSDRAKGIQDPMSRRLALYA